jgi:hypothetical protein
MTEILLRRHEEKARETMLVAHVIYRLDYGGLENGVVNLINQLPAKEFDHAVISVTDATSFSSRINRGDVPIYELAKEPGVDWALYRKLWQTFRALKPDIVHTRNLATIDALVPAWLAGVPWRIHSEHGREMSDIDGDNLKYNRMRRFFSGFTHRYVTVSKDLERWIVDDVGVVKAKCSQIYKPNVSKFITGSIREISVRGLPTFPRTRRGRVPMQSVARS